MNDSEINELWRRCLRTIRDNVSEAQYNTWFAPIKPMKFENGTLTLGVPSPFFYDYLEEKFSELLACVLNKDIAKGTFLEYSVLIDKDNTLTTQMGGKTPDEIHSQQEVKKDSVPEFESHLIPNYVFDTFVKGRSNEYSLAVGEAVAQKPARTFNPLFIYSEVGLGKTHLVNAIGIQTKINFPDKTVVYVSSDTFYQQYVEAIKNRNVNDFIWFYQSVDMLIIDDIQFISGGKGKTQEAFFHIFNSLHQRNKQIIITSDKSPVEISGFEPRLLNRFKWGLTADLQVPDLETRVAIISKKLESNGITFPKEVVDYLALRITSNTRELEGAMIAILAQSSLNHRAITVELAKEMVDKYVKTNAKEISIEYIQKIICDYFKISTDTINAKTRKREIVQARQLSMYFAKKYTKLPLSLIGAYCGNKDHATVLHACRTINNLYETDKKMKLYVDDIDKKMKI